jgi:hypothetical protein
MLIASALAGLLTMALHPTGADVASGGGDFHAVHLAMAVHALAIAAMPLAFAGAAGLARYAGGDDDGDLARLGLVAYATALIGGALAAVNNGLIAPKMIYAMLQSEGTRREAIEAVLSYVSAAGHAFAAIYVIAGAAAVILWSAAMLRHAAAPRPLAIAGIAIAALVLLAFLSGHVRLDVHGFGMIVLAQSLWLIAAAVVLLRVGDAPRDGIAA